MTRLRTSSLRHGLAVVLTIVLTFAGIGRGLMPFAQATAGSVGVAGVASPICHVPSADGRRPLDPAQSGQHDCCEWCSLCAAMLLPGPIGVAARTETASAVSQASPLPSDLAAVRNRTPRQPQGPPLA